jgi:uncharacterized protein YebE (UPF0316 family)
MPIMIILARISDVTFGTIRIILISKGYKKLAPIFSFFEAFVWIIVVSHILVNMSNETGQWITLPNLVAYVAYAVGYALGTYIGMKIEAKLSLGIVLVRAILSIDCTSLVDTLRENKFDLTIMNATGREGSVKILFIVIKRSDLATVMKIICDNNPDAFYTIEDISSVNERRYRNPIQNTNIRGVK